MSRPDRRGALEERASTSSGLRLPPGHPVGCSPSDRSTTRQEGGQCTVGADPRRCSRPHAGRPADRWGTCPSPTTVGRGASPTPVLTSPTSSSRRSCASAAAGTPRAASSACPSPAEARRRYRAVAPHPARRRRVVAVQLPGRDAARAAIGRSTPSPRWSPRARRRDRGGDRPAVRLLRPQHGRARRLRADGGARGTTAGARRAPVRVRPPPTRRARHRRPDPRPARRRVPRRAATSLRRRARGRAAASPSCWRCSCPRCAPTSGPSRRTRR